MPKPYSGHSPWLNVGVAVTSGDDQDHPAAEGTMVLVLSTVVPWAFRNAKSFPLGPSLFNLTDIFYAKFIHSIFVFRWLRKDGPRAIAKLHLASPAS